MGSGTYRQTEKTLLDGADITAKYYRIQIEGAEEDGTVISGAEAISGADFVAVSGENYYVYQFAADESGAYPDFRHLYVNGEVREVALHGYNRTHIADAEGGLMWKITHDGSAPEAVGGRYRMYLPAEAFVGMEISRGKDLDNQDLRISLQQSINIKDMSEVKPIELVDVEARNKTNEIIK
jgi:hypothetical protein